jgi:hypothetical protein
VNSLEILFSDILKARTMRRTDLVNKEDEVLGVWNCDPKTE